MKTEIKHKHEAAGHRGTFNLAVDGKVSGFLSYSIDNDTIAIDYVQVDPSLRGKSLGVQLVGAAVDWARATKRKIHPICSYSRVVMKRTKEFHDVLSD